MTCSRLRKRIIGVVVGAATVETNMSFTILRNVLMSNTAAGAICTSSSMRMVASSTDTVDARRYAEFIKEQVIRGCRAVGTVVDPRLPPERSVGVEFWWMSAAFRLPGCFKDKLRM